MSNLADLMEKHADELAALEVLDVGELFHMVIISIRVIKIHHVGKVFSKALAMDVAASVSTVRYYAGWADKVQGKTLEVCLFLL